MEFQIEVTNQLDAPMDYDVTIEGDCLLGEKKIAIPGKSTYVYSLIYSPLQVGERKGSITIYNQLLGEIWYQLKLVCHKQPPTKLPIFRAELGKFISQEVVLNNPSNHNVETTVVISNELNYEVLPKKLTIKAHDKTSIQIFYTPTNIDTLESGDVIISTQEIGEWKFYLQGFGQDPTDFEDTVVYCPITTELTFKIKFKNPFKEIINVFIDLENFGDQSNVFSSDLERKKQILPGLETL